MLQRFNILIVDDEASLTTLLREELQQRETYYVDLAFDGVEAINLIQKKLYDVVLLDFKMPRVDGREVLKFVQENSPSSQTIMISNFADLQLAVEMTKLGAYDVLGKPYDINQLEQTIERALERKKLSTENKLLQEELERKAGTSEIIGNSKAMVDVLQFAKRVAESDSVVLILGASGTGKELIANYIHRNSPRQTNAFVPLNCSSIPDTLLESELFGHEKGSFTNAYTAKPGLVEVANGGTLFLDEVGDISQTVQPKLLRFLENGSFRRVGGTNELHANVRVLSATNKNLQEESRAGRFREDLLYRLNVFTIKMPLLKDHLDDIPLLVDFFLQKKSKTRQPKIISKAALHALMMYNWPGNIRELEHVIERAIILSSGDIIESHDLHLTDHQSEPESKSFSLDDIEKEHIERVLKIFKGNRSKASDALGISQKTLYTKIKDYGILVE